MPISILRGVLLVFGVALGLMLDSPIRAEETAQQQLKAFLQKAATLEAHFVQVQYDERENPGKRSEGRFFLQRPGKFRWNYEKPHHQQIVAAEDKVWFYDVDLEQVTSRRLDAAIGSTPALLLTGNLPLEANFTIESQRNEEGIAIIKLVPKSEEGGFRYVQIGLEKGQLVGMELSDNFGQLTRIYFDQIKTGLRLDPQTFQFKPPPNVDVFEDS
jgi:outer membrane lipoprotein carrier protein